MKKKNNIYKAAISVVAVLIAAFLGFFTGYDSEQVEPVSQVAESAEPAAESELSFRNEKLLQEHYEKHGIEMGFASAQEYEAAANAVIANQDALHKLEAEDGDDVYYLEETNEFVIVSTDGYIRTYFYPNSGIDYYNRQ